MRPPKYWYGTDSSVWAADVEDDVTCGNVKNLTPDIDLVGLINIIIFLFKAVAIMIIQTNIFQTLIWILNIVT